ncbi:hypothetical protein GWI33_009451 [Rhynchophorus ferrugineus]|uniref:Uncharacterized protein n=1 Tax=Rhynchophorus ferrugineus TaxID=354439 RepID=A0A834MCZ3_RHYFE|nr:hypothetical protein GWI33_009451 [Rhynchophorus ferrugineus]
MEREAAFSKIIFKFPNVIRPLKDCENTHTGHHIDAREPPTPARTRRLAPLKLNCLREETKTLENEGIIRQASWSESSIWSSPVHFVEKKDGSWIICGDYRTLNANTKPDFTSNLHNKWVFTTIDLEKAGQMI